VLQLPAGEDPDEVIRRDFAVWSYAVAHPLPLVDYYFVVKTANLDLREPNGKAEAAKRLLPVIGMISDRVKRDAYIRKLAALIAIDERSLNDELQRVLKGQRAGVVAEFSDSLRQRSSRRVGQQGENFLQQRTSGNGVERVSEIEGEEVGPAGTDKNTRERVTVLDREGRNRVQWEDYLIGLLLQNPGLSTHVCGIINDGDFAGTDTRELYHILNSNYQRDSSPLFQSIEQLVPSALLATIARVRESVESRPPLEGAGLIKYAVQCATRLKKAHLRQLNTELQYLMKEANEAGDVGTVQQFRRQLLAIHQQLRTIDTAMHLQG
jgi:DNA primase